MITIIITALASVFLTLVCGSIIWLHISVRKLKKEVAENRENIGANSNFIGEMSNSTSQADSDIYKHIKDREDDIFKQMDKRFDKVYQTIKESKNN